MRDQHNHKKTIHLVQWRNFTKLNSSYNQIMGLTISTYVTLVLLHIQALFGSFALYTYEKSHCMITRSGDDATETVLNVFNSGYNNNNYSFICS